MSAQHARQHIHLGRLAAYFMPSRSLLAPLFPLEPFYVKGEGIHARLDISKALENDFGFTFADEGGGVGLFTLTHPAKLRLHD